MSAAWAVVIGLAAGTALIKAIGAALGSRQTLPATISPVIACLPPALLAALVVTDTFVRQNHQLGLDARSAGLAAAGIAVFLRAPMIVVIAIGVLVTTLVKALT